MLRTALILLALFPMTGVAATTETCAEAQARIDSFDNLDQVVEYLKLDVSEQNDLDALFQCLASPQRLPTDLLSDGKDYIYGDGWGSIRANDNVPLWNDFQSQLGRSLWGGKILQKSADGVRLLNVMLDRSTMSYAAEVYAAPSLVDGEDAIILDYRADDTVPVISQTFIRRVQDELREIRFHGQLTGIYLGRASLYTGFLTRRFSSEWEDPRRFQFAANFILDFRAKHQETIPEWATKFFE